MFTDVMGRRLIFSDFYTMKRRVAPCWLLNRMQVEDNRLRPRLILNRAVWNVSGHFKLIFELIFIFLHFVESQIVFKKSFIKHPQLAEDLEAEPSSTHLLRPVILQKDYFWCV